MIVVFEGTQEEYWNKMAEIVDQRIQAASAKKVAPMKYIEVCEELGITDKTLKKIRQEMKLDVIFPADLDRILLKYPKYIKKAKRA